MSEQVFKKMKIFNLAKELNLSSETIIDFLKKKGFDVKSHMSSVTEEMMPVIMGHFKKDKEVAERHQRKIQEFRSTRKKESFEKPETAEKVENKIVEKEEIPLQKKDEKPALEEPVVQAVEIIPLPAIKEIENIPVKDILQPELNEVTVIEKPIETFNAVVEVKPKEEIQNKEKEKPTGRAKRQQQTPLEAAVARSQRGLTIKGKIDLTPARNVQKPDIEEKRKKKKKKVREEIRKISQHPVNLRMRKS